MDDGSKKVLSHLRFFIASVTALCASRLFHSLFLIPYFLFLISYFLHKISKVCELAPNNSGRSHVVR